MHTHITCTNAHVQVWENTPGFGEQPFLDTLWSSIDEAIDLKECDVYSYKSDGETDPFGEGLRGTRGTLVHTQVLP